jgi:xylulokinase
MESRSLAVRQGMEQKAYLGLDLGGTGVKAGVFDQMGSLLGFSHMPYRPSVSGQGYVEIPIGEIYAAARDAVRKAMQQSGTRVAAFSIVSQGQTFVSLDEKDRPLHSAIMWYDSRASEQAERLNRTLLSADSDAPVPQIDGIATAPKILWMRDHYPDLMVRAQRYLLLPDYFTYRLTGKAVTDPNTASSTGLYADDASDYSALALTAAGIPEDQLAEIQSAGTPIARVRPRMAKEWGLDPETLVVTGTNDQYAGALGAGNCHPGILSETTGTCLALVTLTRKLPDPLPDGLFGGRFPIPEYQFALAYSKTAGLVLEWFHRAFCPGQSLHDLDEMASHLPIGSHGVLVLPHFDGTVSPVPDADARGAFCNLKLHHTRADMYRAILESLSFSLSENIAHLIHNGFSIEVIRSIGGGARSDFGLQMKADVTGFPVERPVVTEAAVSGAAMLAAVGCGAFSSIVACSERFFRRDRIFTPDPDHHRLYKVLYKRYLELCRKMYAK